MPLIFLLIVACGLPVGEVRGTSDAPTQGVVEKELRTLRVFGEDDRQPVGDTTQFPWSSIGLLEATWRKPDRIIVSTATGTLIGNRIVLTGGHCVYDPEDGWADEVLFIPGRNGPHEPFGRAYSTRSISQRAWVEHGDNRYDLAMIVLDQPLGAQAGYMPIAVESEAFFTNRNLNTAGYPGEIMPGDVQFHAFGVALGAGDGLIRHVLDSEPGQSGSALWYYEPQSQERRLVGVLTGTREITVAGQLIDAYNVAVHIDAAFAGWIQDTLLRYDTVVQDIAVSENVSTATPPGCAAGLPVAAMTMLVLIPLMRRAGGTPRRNTFRACVSRFRQVRR
jgi:V8-like Glu-specific endopeptidase